MNETMYEQAVEYLFRVPQFAKKCSFEETKDFLSELGQFEKLDHVIHVAGTNGKGSVCNYVQSILLESGFRVGMFTSPHLVCVNERIRIQGVPVSDEVFTDAFVKVKACVDERVKRGKPHPAFFEFVFAMACVIFKEAGLDYIILETGLGGRLDATNIIEKPLVTVITSVGLDHMEYLGNTIEAIAGEKAGIIKQSVPVVFDASNKETEAVICRKAEENGCKLVSITKKGIKIEKITNKYIDFLFQYSYDEKVFIKLRTCALYQVDNAMLAVEAVKCITDDVDVKAVKNGLEKTTWAGRMEWLDDRFLIDGAHNIDGIQKAVATINQMKKKVILLFSAVQEKAYDRMIAYLCDNLSIEEIVITQLQLKRAADAEQLKTLFETYSNKDVVVIRDIAEAVSFAKQRLRVYEDEENIVFAVGSLYLIGELKRIEEKVEI